MPPRRHWDRPSFLSDDTDWPPFSGSKPVGWCSRRAAGSTGASILRGHRRRTGKRRQKRRRITRLIFVRLRRRWSPSGRPTLLMSLMSASLRRIPRLVIEKADELLDTTTAGLRVAVWLISLRSCSRHLFEAGFSRPSWTSSPCYLTNTAKPHSAVKVTNIAQT